jgi:hypothetical protein
LGEVHHDIWCTGGSDVLYAAVADFAEAHIDLFIYAPPVARNVIEPPIGAICLRLVYLGDLDTAPALDGMTRIWFAQAFGQNCGW